MARVKNIYLEKKVRGTKKNPNTKSVYSNVFIVKKKDQNSGWICLDNKGHIHFPKEFIGKKVRFLVELVNERGGF